MMNVNTGPPQEIVIRGKVACFPDKWEVDLASEIPNFEDMTAEAKSELGLHSDSGKPLVARYIAKKLTSNDPPTIPSSINTILENSTGQVREFCNTKRKNTCIITTAAIVNIDKNTKNFTIIFK